MKKEKKISEVEKKRKYFDQIHRRSKFFQKVGLMLVIGGGILLFNEDQKILPVLAFIIPGIIILAFSNLTDRECRKQKNKI